MRGKDLKPRKLRGCVSLAPRFWGYVDKGEGDSCWEWQAAIAKTGYGVLRINRKTVKAHRVSWEITHGKIPEGKLVCHKCDNRKCVRPDHLFLGDSLANNKDMTVKERHGRMFFSHEDARRIRVLYQKYKGPRLKPGLPRIPGVLTHQRIADFFGVSKATISHMMTARNWKYA